MMQWGLVNVHAQDVRPYAKSTTVGWLPVRYFYSHTIEMQAIIPANHLV
jgi:hypothetical protein